MGDLEKTDPLYWEHIMIENELHQLITLIEEGSMPKEKKEKLKEETYIEFLKRAKGYKGCHNFENMTKEELKEEYKKFRDSLDKKNEGR